MSISADYFDGRSARRRPVELSLAADRLIVAGEGVQREEALSSVRVPERLGQLPRRVEFVDGAHCAVGDQPGADAFFEALGHRESWVERGQRSLLLALISLALIMACGVAAYFWLLPWATDRLAERVPQAAIEMLSERTLKSLDEHVLKPSELPPERQQQLSDRFAALAKPGATPNRVQFRNSPMLGANALALPDGQLLVLDGLVQLADNDEELLGVMAHELGHAQLRHGLRQILRTTVIGAAMAWWVGDFSVVLAAGPTLLAQARYSRELETEADDFAVDLLLRNGIWPERLAQMLEKLERYHAGRDRAARPESESESESDASATQPSQERDSSWRDYLSTHPATPERLRHLRERSAP